jgi:hypothetical protein
VTSAQSQLVAPRDGGTELSARTSLAKTAAGFGLSESTAHVTTVVTPLPKTKAGSLKVLRETCPAFILLCDTLVECERVGNSRSGHGRRP